MDDRLERLAAAHGVATGYDDQLSRPVTVSEASVRAVLTALGVDPDSDPDDGTAGGPPPVVVMRQSTTRDVEGLPGAAVVELEDGGSRELDGATLPAGLPLGWHQLVAGSTRLPLCVAPDTLAGGDRSWGWMVQLYALRSEQSWGVGDLGDLETLATWTAAHGGGLVLVNPLHAVMPGTPVQPSPYYPASRRWTNPLYLRVEDTAEYADASPELRAEVDTLAAAVPAADGTPDDRIDRDAALTAKLAALELLAPPGGGIDGGVVDDPDLRDFATWCALVERHGRDWREWPEELRRPDGPAVAAQRDELAGRVAFHAWLQRLCDEQLSRVQDAARGAGMPVGIVHDLAVGTDPAGADAWALQDALALGAHIGAPPDGFNQQGQDWGMPPWHPRRLAELGYAPLRDMVRALLRHAGGVRIDHVLGVFRAWWVPAGGSAKDGTYVSYDADAMLGVIALEAHLAGAVVVGEDLGTTPSSVRTALADLGVAGSSVLWFEREDAADGVAGGLRPFADWREAAMASVTTHDLPTVLGWLRGEHVRVRAELGLLDDPAEEQRSWQQQRAEVVTALRDADLVTADEPDELDLAVALHRALVLTPSRFVVAAPGDAVGDLRAPNLPGTTTDYPSWQLRVTDASGHPVRLEELLADERVRRLAADLARVSPPTVG